METTPSDREAADGGSPFPELLAGMVATGAADSDARATSSDGPPRYDTPAGSETLPGGAAKNPPDTRKPAAARADPREPSEDAAQLPMTDAQAPAPNQDPPRLAVGQTIFGVRTRSAPATPVSTESSDGDGKSALTGVPAPVELPPANPDPTDSSGRRAGRRSSGRAVAQVLALSGQMPRTVDSISPADPAGRPVETAAGAGPFPEQRAAAPPADTGTAPQSLAESLVSAEGAGVRVLAASTPDRDEVAFAVRMKAMSAPGDAARGESPGRLAAVAGLRGNSVPAQPGEVPAPDPAAAAGEKHPSQGSAPDPAPARAGRERGLEAAPAERGETPTATAAGKTIPHAVPDTQARAETAPEGPDTTAAKPVRPQDAIESETRPEAAKATEVRDMKFEITGGERRVEVRLSERSGEVKMTVRTADAPLASSLRENLPALSARLAESGFKSQAWHPAASSPNEWRNTAESSAGGAAHDTNQDANAHPRGQDGEPQDGAGQRRPKSLQEAAPQKEKGRDFAWLISSLR